MNKTYCGACHGERGCPDCEKAAKSAVYTSLTEFLLPDGTGCDGLFLVADLGTTTLAFVCEDENGTVSYGTENPQRSVAADVIGRVDAAMQGKREQLQAMIREALAKGFLFVLETLYKQREKKIEESEPENLQIAIAGNTVMQHLLIGHPVDGLARAPFTPYTTEKSEVTFASLFSECSVYAAFPDWIKRSDVTVFPCFSAFVGGDVVAGTYALFPEVLRERGNRTEQTQSALLMDLGTNGELLLWNGERLSGTAAAMGSAFEGGRFSYASELFRLVAGAIRQGVLDETGLLCEPYFTEGFEGVLQEDIREFQLAKGALRAGTELLCQKSGIALSGINRIYIAGGTGRFCAVEDLFQTGLLPEEFYGKVSFVGNSCMGGLLRYVRDRKPELWTEGEFLNLAEQPEFEALYYRYMNFV